MTILTKNNIKNVLAKAKEKLWYMAIDCKTGNPVDLRNQCQCTCEECGDECNPFWKKEEE